MGSVADGADASTIVMVDKTTLTTDVITFGIMTSVVWIVLYKC